MAFKQSAYRPGVPVVISTPTSSITQKPFFIPLVDDDLISFRSYMCSGWKNRVRETGGETIYIYNNKNYELYRVEMLLINDFDLELTLFNELLSEFVFKTTIVVHNSKALADFLEEVPGLFTTNKIKAYKKLYNDLALKCQKIKTAKRKEQYVEILKFLVERFPEFVV